MIIFKSKRINLYMKFLENYKKYIQIVQVIFFYFIILKNLLLNLFKFTFH